MTWNSRPLVLATLGTLLTAMSALAQNAPVAYDQPQTITSEDTAKTITLLATDLDGDSLTYEVVGWPAHGTLAGTPPDLTYQPAADYNGPDSFTFKASDGSADSNTATVSLEVTPVNDAPIGTVIINAGVAATRSTAATLTLTASDDSVGAIQVCVSNSNTATCSAWAAFTESPTTGTMTRNWTLSRGSGEKYVYVWLRDQLGKTSAAPHFDTIVLDTTAPTIGTVDAVPSDRKLTLNWGGFVDNTPGSGITGYRVAFQKSSSAPSSCTAGTQIPVAGTATMMDHANLDNGITYGYRVCAIDAVGNISTGATVIGKPVPELVPPDGSVEITPPVAATKSTSVTLSLKATDASVGPIQVCVSSSNTVPCSAWAAYLESPATLTMNKSWTLPSGSGEKYVYVWFRDQWGNTSAAPASDSIILDTTAPTNGTVTVTAGITQQLTLNWSESTDNTPGSGLAGYRVVFQAGNSAPSSCTSGTPLTPAPITATTLMHSGLTDGTTYGYRVCASDAVGNISTGATVIGKPVPELVPPDGSVEITPPVAVTKSTSVTLSLKATDASVGPIQVCVSSSNTVPCSAWAAYVESPATLAMNKTWTLPSGSGEKYVYAWFRDRWGNTSAAPHFDTIVLDTTAPTDGTVETVPGDAKLTLTWGGFEDNTPGSGISGYRVAFQKSSSAPSSCTAGTQIPVVGTATTMDHANLDNGITYAYRVCAIDAVGNISSGATKTGKPVDTTPPTGTVTINGGAAFANSTTVMLSLTAVDAGGGAILMCISNTGTCSTWMTFVATKTWTLSGGSGNTPVNVWFRDRWGNTSATPNSDTIFLDTTAPTDGTVEAVPGDTKLTLNWGGFEDNTPGSGITGYRVVFQEGSAPPSCTAGSQIPVVGTATTLVHNGRTNGTIYGYRVCAIDAVDNFSSGATAAAKPVDTTPPTGTVTINGGAALANSTAATLSLAAADAGGGAIQMCISNAATCSDWMPFAAMPSWTLAAGNGTTTVNVWFRDQWGNTSATPNSDTIFLDTTAPTDGTVTVTPGDTQLTLNWSGFADTAGSGITGYRAVFQEGGVPASCSGTTVPGYAGTATTLLHTGLVNGTIYGYRVCAIDAVGNSSSGATVTGRPVSNNCAECHQGNPDYPLAPDVMTYWAGSLAGQDGGHGDPGGFAAVICTACHDTNLPASPPAPISAQHGTGTYNSIWANDATRSTNTSHLRAEFFTKYPAVGAGDWSVQVAIDNYCAWECHDKNRNGSQDSGEPAQHKRHTKKTDSGANDYNAVEFGMGMTPPAAYPNPDDMPDIPIDVDLNTDAAGGGNYAPCVGCHDPHGTGTPAPPTYPSNRMVRFRFPPDIAVLCSKCHK